MKEDFLGFYELENIKRYNVVKAIKDILLRCHLQLEDCRGQTFDSASNMMGKHFGVATQITAEQPKAVATHCQGHSLSLAVKSFTSSCVILPDTMGPVGEICVLVKYSPKREKMLGKLTENVEGEFTGEDKVDKGPSRLEKLYVTRWTVRASFF